MEWSTCLTSLRQWFALMREASSWSHLGSKDAIRWSWTSLVPSKACASLIWDLRLVEAEGADGDRRTGIWKSGAASRGSTLFWSCGRSMLQGIDYEAIAYNLRCVFNWSVLDPNHELECELEGSHKHDHALLLRWNSDEFCMKSSLFPGHAIPLTTRI